MSVTVADAAPRRIAWLTVGPLDLVRRRPEILTAVLCAAMLALDVRGPDLPAQNYRVWLLRHHGFVVFDSHWYAGHTLPGYSMLFPPLAAVLGARLVGSIACIAATAALTRLVRRGADRGHDVALIWFAVVVTINLAVGRLPFVLGFAAGIGALVAAREGRPAWAGVLAFVTSASSPLAGAFLLLVALAWATTEGWRIVRPLGFASLGIVAAQAFGESGRFPFSAWDLFAILATVVVGLVVLPRDRVLVRRFLLLYGFASVVLYALPNPIGGNMERLDALLVGPVAAYEVLSLRRFWRVLLAFGTVPLLWWQLAPIPDVIASTTSASAHSAYYTGLVRYLDAHGGTSGRIEVPLTASRWETDYLATRFALARGWERQVDLGRNAVLYDPHLSAAAYLDWLHDNAVRWVALPDMPLDASEAGEKRLLATAGRLPFLQPVWHDAHWQLWAVRDPTSLVTGPASLVSLDVSSFTLRATSSGTATVLVRWTRFWEVVAGSACVMPSPDGWTQVELTGPGDVTVSAGVDPSRLVGGGSAGSCSPGLSLPQ